MLNSVFISGFKAYTSLYRIWRSSGLGWTVMPCAPKASQSNATFNTFGTLPPRALRMVATLLMFTLKFVIVYRYIFFLSLHLHKSIGKFSSI